MSDTPRTDAYSEAMTNAKVPQSRSWPYWYGFARLLERELAEARKQRDTLAKTVRVYLDTERDGGILYSDALSELQEALAAVKGGQNG
jgi:hypothetical protein